MSESNTTNSADTAESGLNSTFNDTESDNVYTMALKPPKHFAINSELDMAQEWNEWLQMYENYFVAAKVNKEEADVQTANFINAAGRDVLKIINNLKLNDTERKDLKVLKEKLTAHFAPSKNKTYERCRIHRMKQQANEPIENFLQKLKTQIKRCTFPGESDEFVMDQVVLGVHSETTRQKLWTEDDLNLEKAIKICKAAERAEKEMNELQNERSSSANINAVSNESQSFNCKRCGTKHGYRECPAYNKNCASCGGRGHFKVMCRTKSKEEKTKNIDRAKKHTQYYTNEPKKSPPESDRKCNRRADKSTNGSKEIFRQSKQTNGRTSSRRQSPHANRSS